MTRHCMECICLGQELMFTLCFGDDWKEEFEYGDCVLERLPAVGYNFVFGLTCLLACLVLVVGSVRVDFVYSLGFMRLVLQIFNWYFAF